MLTFSGHLASRTRAGPLLLTAGGAVSSDEIISATPLLETTPRPRIALSIHSTASLLRVLIAYDGYASALVLLSSDLHPDIVSSIAKQLSCTCIISDREEISNATAPELATIAGVPGDREIFETDWILTTSGTTGLPKMVRHRLSNLVRTARRWKGECKAPVWGLTYEPTRFAGLQVLLQAVTGGGILAAPDLNADLGQRIGFFADVACTHLSATPTLWRRILMHPATSRLNLQQITLGGEIADQTILDALRFKFPNSLITHVYASTETGVGFSVKDGLEGFPKRFLEEGVNGNAFKVANGRLWMRVPDAPSGYLSGHRMLRDREGFINTLDQVECRGDRVIFLGRDTGVVNVGGSKVYPETVERTINMLPEVALARVSSRRNPFSGWILVAHVVPAGKEVDSAALKAKIIQHCRAHLSPEAVPALVHLCGSLTVNTAGKLVRD